MLLGARQFFERRGAPTPPLPYDAEVEYLESTGTQWIDTGLNSTTDGFCDFDLVFRMTGASNTPPIGYKYASSARYGMWDANGITIGPNNANSVSMTLDTNEHGVSLRNGIAVTIDGVSTPVGTGTVRANIGFLLFAMITSSRGASSYYTSKAQIKSCKIYDANGAVLRDYIPVRVGTVGYMYDKVLGQLFGNQGTGAFTIGPDKS